MFEYSQKVTFLSKMGFYTRLLLFVVFIVLIMMFSSTTFLAWLLLVTTILCLIAGVSMKDLLSSLKPLSLVFFFIFIFTALSFDVSDVQHEYAQKVYFIIYEGKFITLSLTSGGMLAGLAFVIKMVIMMFSSALFVCTTPMEEILHFMEIIGMPYQLGLMMSIALRFFPTLTDEVSQIQQAQKARGAGVKHSGGTKQAIKGTIPLFVPMIVSSIRRSDTMAMSMISRGYGYKDSRTNLVTLTFDLMDVLYSIIIILILAILIWLKIKTGFGGL